MGTPISYKLSCSGFVADSDHSSLMELRMNSVIIVFFWSQNDPYCLIISEYHCFPNNKNNNKSNEVQIQKETFLMNTGFIITMLFKILGRTWRSIRKKNSINQIVMKTSWSVSNPR